jgi:mannosyl-3-phosphoglycerate phosphatase
VLIVFSDLDGTILDLKDYSWSGARGGITKLKSAGFPLVAASGKTADEISAVASETGLDYPFIYENGAGIAWGPDQSRHTLLAPPMDKFISALHELARVSEKELQGINSMPIEHIVRHTGLSSERALLASRRSGSLPFLISGEKTVDGLNAEYLNSCITGGMFRVIKGGKFYHLLPEGIDKGSAVRTVIKHYAALLDRPPVTAAVGDGENDLPMFAETDMAVAVRFIDPEKISALDKNVFFTEHKGPAGFTEAADMILKRYYEMEN